MKKHFVIGTTAALAIGVAAYVLSQPRKGTVEWHKRELRSVTKGPWKHRAKNLYRLVRGQQEDPYDLSSEGFKLRQRHAGALVRLGYLEECKLVLSNRAVYNITVPKTAWPRVRQEFVDIQATEWNVFVLAALPADLLLISNAIRQADVPATK